MFNICIQLVWLCFYALFKTFLDFSPSLIRRDSDYEGQGPLYMNVTSDYEVRV